MERSGLIVLAFFATLSAVTACDYETECYSSCCDGYCCSDSNSSYSSNSIGAGWIVLIVAVGALKIFFWSCVCGIRRNRRSTIIRRVVVSGPPAGANTTVVNTSHVASPVNPNHAGYNQQGQQQQWFQPMPQVQPQANPQSTISNIQAPPPYSSVLQQGVSQNVIPV